MELKRKKGRPKIQNPKKITKRITIFENELIENLRKGYYDNIMEEIKIIPW